MVGTVSSPAKSEDAHAPSASMSNVQAFEAELAHVEASPPPQPALDRTPAAAAASRPAFADKEIQANPVNYRHVEAQTAPEPRRRAVAIATSPAPGGVDVAVQTSDWTPKPATTMPGRWVDNTSSYKAPVFDEQTSPKTGAAGSQQPEPPKRATTMPGTSMSGRWVKKSSSPFTPTPDVKGGPVGKAGDDSGEKESLASWVERHAANQKKGDLPGLMKLLEDKHLTVEEAETLRREAELRDNARAYTFGVFNSFGHVSNEFVTHLIQSYTPNSLAAKIPVGIAVSSVVSTATDTVFESLGPQRRPLPSVRAKPVRHYDREAPVQDHPYNNLLKTELAAGLATNMTGMKAGPATATRIAAGVAGFMWRAATTNSTNRTIETGNGKIKELPWLDANDLAKTEKNIDDLRQKRLRAVGGYIVDAGSLLWKRGAPAIAKAVPQSPRPWAYLVALVPSGALGSMSRSATDPVKAMGLELSASLLHTSGLQWRLEIEKGIEWAVHSSLGYTWNHHQVLGKVFDTTPASAKPDATLRAAEEGTAGIALQQGKAGMSAKRAGKQRATEIETAETSTG